MATNKQRYPSLQCYFVMNCINAELCILYLLCKSLKVCTCDVVLKRKS